MIAAHFNQLPVEVLSEEVTKVGLDAMIKGTSVSLSSREDSSLTSDMENLHYAMSRLHQLLEVYTCVFRFAVFSIYYIRQLHVTLIKQ